MRPVGTKPSKPLHAEQGSGTVLAVAGIMILGVLMALILALSAVGVARTQAAAAADLAALAAADTARGLVPGATDPCAVAAEMLATHQVELALCEVGGEHPTEVRVTVRKDVELLTQSSTLRLPGLTATMHSRAGPPEALTP